jgi:transposase-like protein
VLRALCLHGCEPQLLAVWRRQLEADAEAGTYTDASQHQAASTSRNPWPPQRVPDMNPAFTPIPEPRTNPENEPEQDDRTARLDELLARADQATQRIAAQQGERQAGSDYAARMELEAHTQTQVEAGHRPWPMFLPG